jgi:hypothetical protein
MTHDVFISYSNKDKLVADSVCVNLEAAGVRCWIAPRDIAPGEDWPTAITRAISLSRVMVLIFSAHSNSSEDVGRELILAANNKLVIIPFKIDNIEPEPGKQYYLARTHWLDAINPPTQEQIRELLECVKVLIPVRKTPSDFDVQPTAVPDIDQPIPAKVTAAHIPGPPAPTSPIAMPGAAEKSTARAFHPEGQKKPRKPGERKPAWKYLLILVAALIVLTIAWFGLYKIISRGKILVPTITPAATFALPVTMTPAATITPTFAILPTQGTYFSRVYISDAFNDNSNEWLVGDVDGTSWVGSRSVQNGVWDWEGVSRGEMLSPQFPGRSDRQEKFTDMQVSSRVNLLNPTMNGFYGVIIRGTDENNLMSFYAFVIDNSGNYAFMLYTDSKLKNLSDWRENPYIKNNDWNKMTVQATGDHFSLFMNDNLLSEIIDGTLPGGKGGIIVDLFTGRELISIQFDDFEMRLPSP